MKGWFCLLLLLGFGLLDQGAGLRCFKCLDYTGRCETVQECTYEDACISLSERGGKTVRQCLRYTDCDNSRLSQMFPAISGFTYRCCSSNLCNAASVSVATPALALIGSLTVFWLNWLWTLFCCPFRSAPTAAGSSSAFSGRPSQGWEAGLSWRSPPHPPRPLLCETPPLPALTNPQPCSFLSAAPPTSWSPRMASSSRALSEDMRTGAVLPNLE
ncbi:CD59 glycoprotein [Merluccius polli]|uniref:MAC-inhibitory protein n=1 Tax=Merluccius polli TaxID=89951 RepID=A0AA47P983_MERPO|nr:CD59 glycoprotein [Merluccius polli]